MPVLYGTKCIKKKNTKHEKEVICKMKHAFALRLRVLMIIMILECSQKSSDNLPTPRPSPLSCTVFTHRLVSGHVYEVNIAF